MNTILLRSRTTTKISCSSEKKESSISISRKQFEKKRNISLKENVNKLLIIASSDLKEYSDFFKELDEIHKKEINKIIDKVKNKSSESSIIEESIEDSDDYQNIFINKDN
jgi:uncharacterized membrane protein YjjP (DUF1212 family)